jgi:hypothetical protein
MTLPIPIFHNDINALGDFRGVVKVARDFAPRSLKLYAEGAPGRSFPIATIRNIPEAGHFSAQIIVPFDGVPL